MADATIIHATCLALGERGVLLLGPPGSGKSDLALRLIDQPGRGTDGTLMTAMLVADDQTRIERRGDALFASAPAAIAGRLEIRGLGVVALPYAREVQLALAAGHKAAAYIERLPGESRYAVAGLDLPLIALDFRAASAPARLRAAVKTATAKHIAS